MKLHRDCGSGRRLWLSLGFLLLSLSATVRAAVFDELYTVSVERNLEARDARTDAARRGMRLLLTRITGRQQAAEYPEAQQLISNAAQYLSQYSPSGSEVRVGFRRGAVNDVLTSLEMPIWGDERPLTLLWVAADFGDGQRAELEADADSGLQGGAVRGVASNPLTDEAADYFAEVTDEILAAADERGLPLVLPWLDAEDRRYVRFADVWGGFDRVVARASERYAPDALMIARVLMTPFGPEVAWIVRRGDRVETLKTPQARLGIDWLADEFAAEYATVGGVRLARITVRDVGSAVDLFRVQNLLDGVSIIESVDVESMTGTDVVFRVAARGDDDRLLRYLTLDGQLAEDESADGLALVPTWLAIPNVLDAP